MEDKIFASLAKIAKSDIESAILLYSKGNYYNSMFLFQQAVEKGYKAAALVTKQLGLEDLKKVGHDYMKLLKKVITSGFNGSNHPFDPVVYKLAIDDAELDPNEVHSTIGDVKRNAFFDLKDEDIEAFLSLISMQQAKFPEMLSTAFENPDFRKMVAIYANTPLAESDLYENDLLTLPKEESKYIFDTLNHVFTLNILGMLTSPHSEQARYPSYNTADSSFVCPTEVYNESMPLVKHQMKLMQMAQESINFLNS